MGSRHECRHRTLNRRFLECHSGYLRKSSLSSGPLTAVFKKCYGVRELAIWDTGVNESECFPVFERSVFFHIESIAVLELAVGSFAKVLGYIHGRWI